MTTTNGERVDHPDHCNAHPSGVECITVVEHMTFNLGSAVKYIWRADHKAATIEDLQKAQWYIGREIERLSSGPELKKYDYADTRLTESNLSDGGSI